MGSCRTRRETPPPRGVLLALGASAAALGLLLAGAPALADAKKPAKKEAKADPKKGAKKGCPAGMVSILGKFCIDPYEAHVVELVEKEGKKGKKTVESKKHSPFQPVDNLRVKAQTKKGAIPQAYISRDQAEGACKEAGKRLCTDDEWVTACKGKKPTLYPYGDSRTPGRCNDQGLSSFNVSFGVGGQAAAKEQYTWEKLNDPRLNQMKGTLASSGSFAKCKNGFGVYDMVGNVHEWTSNPGGTFRGGYYLDVTINGEGCNYKTTAHNAKYHDYSTGFRCCK